MFELPGQPVCCANHLPRESRALYYTFRVLFFYLLAIFRHSFRPISHSSVAFPYFSISLVLPHFSCAISKCGPLLQYSMVGMHCGRARDNILQASAHTHTHFPSQIFCDSLISLFVSIVFFLFFFYFHLFFSSRQAMLRYATFGVVHWKREVCCANVFWQNISLGSWHNDSDGVWESKYIA